MTCFVCEPFFYIFFLSFSTFSFWLLNIRIAQPNQQFKHPQISFKIIFFFKTTHIIPLPTTNTYFVSFLFWYFALPRTSTILWVSIFSEISIFMVSIWEKKIVQKISFCQFSKKYEFGFWVWVFFSNKAFLVFFTQTLLLLPTNPFPAFQPHARPPQI